MAHSWKYVTVRDDEEWFGLYPIPRAEVRMTHALGYAFPRGDGEPPCRICALLMSTARAGPVR